MKQVASFPIPIVFVCLFVTSSVFAQPPLPKATPHYLDFGQFSTVVSTDQLDFLDKVKWAGMKFVAAPAKKGVVAIYKYNKEDFAKYKCSDKQLREHHALVVARLVSRTKVDLVLKGSTDPSAQQALNALMNTPKTTRWLSFADLKQDAKREKALKQLGVKAQPVWHELTFSNSCELRKMLDNLDYKVIDWHVVDDPKLRWLIQSGVDTPIAMNAFKPSVIATTSLFSGSSGQKQFFAECQSKYRYRTKDDSLCGKVLR